MVPLFRSAHFDGIRTLTGSASCQRHDQEEANELFQSTYSSGTELNIWQLTTAFDARSSPLWSRADEQRISGQGCWVDLNQGSFYDGQ